MEDQHESVKALLQDITTVTEERPIQQATFTSDKREKNKPSESPGEKEDPESDLQEEPVEMSKEMLESSADIVINLFDFSQTNIFRSFLTRRKKNKAKRLYGNDALEKLEKLVDEVDAMQGNKVSQRPLRELSADEWGLLRLEKAAEEYLEGLPLTDNEHKALKVPLMEIMKKRGGSIPPEIALLLAVLQISGARTAELYMI